MPENKKFKDELTAKVAGYILAGFGFVAALAWNEAIKSLLDEIFGSARKGISAKFIYALLITLIVVLISMKIAKFIKGEKESEFNEE